MHIMGQNLQLLRGEPFEKAKAEKAYSFILSGCLVIISQRYGNIATTEHSPRVTCINKAQMSSVRESDCYLAQGAMPAANDVI